MNNEDIMLTLGIDQLGIRKAVKEVNRNLTSIKFAGYAMSIMFFGQQLQRTFSSIARFGTKTFQDVMHSVAGTVTQADLLDSSFKYLGFTIGQALEPLIATLVPIIDRVSEWVTEHEELTKKIVATGVALGAIFAVGGAGVLAINGFIELAAKLGLLKLNAEGAITSIDGLKGALTKIGGAIAIGVSFNMISGALDDFKQGKVAKGIVESIAAASTAAGGIALATGRYKAAGALLVVGIALNLVAEGQFLQTLYSIGGKIAAILGASVEKALDFIAERYNNSTFAKLTGLKLGTSGKSFQELVDQRYNAGLSAAISGDKAMSNFLGNQKEQIVNYNGVYVSITAPAGADMSTVFDLAKQEYDRRFA